MPDGENDPVEAVRRLDRLFADAEILRSDPDRWALALWLLIDPSSAAYGLALADEKVPWSDRSGALASIEVLFDRFFAWDPRNDLQHARSHGAIDLPLLRFMFWDVLPVRPKGDDDRPAQSDKICLDIMEKATQSSNPAVAESGLHGLGHWQCAFPFRTGQAIDRFLARNTDMPGSLLDYAAAARAGRTA